MYLVDFSCSLQDMVSIKLVLCRFSTFFYFLYILIINPIKDDGTEVTSYVRSKFSGS